ncbi:divalent-cation tolerance protein CutA [Candidatus Micrarchaeota archaeon]|nr:MAG: divalent-cation tolerance protein CutA [Candidatus Micrarchaeota archaeon]
MKGQIGEDSEFDSPRAHSRIFKLFRRVLIMLSLYVTFPDEKSATRIARALVKEDLIACANLFPIKSIYKWKDKVNEEREWAMIGKCAKSKLKKAERLILQLHSYDVPCIVWHDEKATSKYSKWVG